VVVEVVVIDGNVEVLRKKNRNDGLVKLAAGGRVIQVYFGVCLVGMRAAEGRPKKNFFGGGLLWVVSCV
jgi:hypothetical protein